MLGLGKYVTGGLGIGVAALGIVCAVQCSQVRAKKETIVALRGQLASETKVAKDCALEMGGLRTKQDEVNAEVARLKKEAAESQAKIEGFNRAAREAARAERRLAEIAEERDALEARLAGLPRCDKYLATLLAIAGEEP